MKQLVIAEKPSVAQSIAAVLGAKERKNGYTEGADHIVSPQLLTKKHGITPNVD